MIFALISSKHSPFDVLLTIDSQYRSMKHFRIPNYKELDLQPSQNFHCEFYDLNIFLPSTVSQTFAATNICLLLYDYSKHFYRFVFHQSK